MQHFMQTLESKLDSQLGSVMKEVRNAVSAIPSTVERTVTAEVGKRLQSSIDCRAKDVIKKQLHLTSIDSDADEDEDDVPLPQFLPKTITKLKDKDRRTSFYQSGGRHATFLHPKSPIDVEYHVVGNDELISSVSSEESLDTKQSDACKTTHDCCCIQSKNERSL